MASKWAKARNGIVRGAAAVATGGLSETGFGKQMVKGVSQAASGKGTKGITDPLNKAGKKAGNALGTNGAPSVPGSSLGTALAAERAKMVVPNATAATIAMAPQAEFRAGQTQNVQALQDAAAGKGPSLAEGQLKQATESSMAQNLAMARSGAPGGGGMRQALRSNAGLQQAAGADSAQMRIQEQQNARSMLGQALEQARSGDIGLATSQAGLDQGATLANQNAILQQNQGLLQGQVSANGQLVGAQTAANTAQQQKQGAVLGALGSLGAAGIAASDPNEKEDIKSADMGDFLDSLKAYQYKYKNPEHVGEAPGKRFGILSTDMKKTQPGASIVNEGPNGVDYLDTDQGFGVALAAMADMNKRLKSIESKRK